MLIAKAGIIMIMLSGAVLNVKVFGRICPWQGDNCIVAFLFLVCDAVHLCYRYASCSLKTLVLSRLPYMFPP